MLNDRLIGLGSAPNDIRTLFAYGLKRKAEIGEDKVFDFSIGNPSVPAPKEVSDCIRRLMDEDPVALHGYTPSPGALAPRQADADLHLHSLAVNQRFERSLVAAEGDHIRIRRSPEGLETRHLCVSCEGSTTCSAECRAGGSHGSGRSGGAGLAGMVIIVAWGEAESDWSRAGGSFSFPVGELYFGRLSPMPERLLLEDGRELAQQFARHRRLIVRVRVYYF